MTICCSNPAVPPNYTVCFPSTQVIPDGSTQVNPYYDFAAQISYWTYSIEISPAGPELKDLSHWVLQICPDDNLTAQDFLVDISINGGASFFPIAEIEVLAVDPTTGVQNVLKIDRAQDKGTTIIYRIAIIDPAFFNLAAGAGTIAIKAGPQSFYFDENTCLHALPTPSVNCDRVSPPPPLELTLTKRCPQHTTIIYTVGDTLSINLHVTNPGSSDVLNVTVLDSLNIPADVIIGNILTDPAATLTPAQATYTNQDLLITWSGLTIPPGVTSLAFQFTILDAPVLETVITDIDAGIGSLSGTTRYQCIIAVARAAPITTIICDLQLCLAINSTRIVDLLLPSYGFCAPAPCLAVPGVCPAPPPPQCAAPLSESSLQSENRPAISQPLPGLCPPDGCPQPLRIECVRLEKVYDSCFIAETISRTATVPFANLPPGSLVSCSPFDITCQLENRTFNPDGTANITLVFFISVILASPANPQITVLRTWGRLKRLVICAPEGTTINCSNSRVLSCVCYAV